MSTIRKIGIVKGSNSSDLQSALEHWLREEKPAHIIAMTGVNETCPYGTGDPMIVIAYTTEVL